MAYEPKDGDFTLSVNNRKEKPTHPDYTGKILWNGKQHFLNAWLKNGKDGSQFLTGSMGQEMRPKSNTPSGSGSSGFPGTKNLPPLQPPPPPGPPPPPVQPALDDDIPF